MNGTIRHINHHPYLVQATAPQRVFVAEMPTMRPASYAPHTGFGTLLCRLWPLRDRDAPALCSVALPSGRVIDVLADHVCPADTLAPRRILPAQDRARRTA